MDKEEKHSKALEAPMYVPVHMKGADGIASVFGVKRETVVQWQKGGAPIRIIGKKYQANYAELWEWLRGR